METNAIKKCRSCGSTQLQDIISLGKQYLSEFRSDEILPESFPLSLVLCKVCTLLQLKHTTPPRMLYNDGYGYKSGINNTIRADLKDVVVKACIYIPNGIVVDIGANDGELLSNYDKNKYFRVGFEPVTKLAKECADKASFVINEYFSAELYEQAMGDKKANIITAISMFYDLDDPNKFVKDIVKILDKEGILIIQQNYLAGMLRQNAFDNVVHEHLEYYSLSSLEKLLSRHYLEIFDVETSTINGGSFRVYVRHMDNVKKMRLMEKELKLHQKATYIRWAEKIKELGVKTYEFIKKVNEEGKTVYLYGASTRGNTLIQYCNLNNKLIKAAVERNPEKWGTKISSLQIPIISEEQARKEKPDYMLVLPWFFKTEFLKREKEYLVGGGHFIFPLPEFEII